MIPFGLESLMTLSLPLARRATKCFVPGAAAIYLFNEGTGTTLRDFSGNAYDGTLGAGAAAPTWTPQGVSYDGGDWINLSSLVPALKGLTEFTLQIVCSTTTSAPHKGIFGAAKLDTNANAIRIRDSTNGSADADAVRVQVTDGTAITSLQLPGRLTATPDLITVRFRGGEVLEARKGLYGTWARETTGVVAATNALETFTSFYLGRAGDFYFRVGADSFFTVYPTFLADAQVDQNCRAINAIMAPRGIDINL